MPHPAVSITLGLLAATAVTALVAKEVIENLDEIHDRYDAFADDIEQRHDIRLPRFRRRYSPYYSSHHQESNTNESRESTRESQFETPHYESERWDDKRYEEQWETIPHDTTDSITHDTPLHAVTEVEKEGSAVDIVDGEWSDTWTVTDGETETWSNSEFNDQ